ncbi:hypothetical protein [Sanyastnella coralliicola]|uniref:hypothetical protein n=1 Tax=Sanyastnella coralliicola TaxID=3069118 RepID=UPI0027B8A653|nr:hypothetical protein [Longitalea sp. SCSIO 12813]
MRTGTLVVFFLTVIATAFWSCRKDNFTTDPNATLSFSQDTVLFDTVFTTIGSITELVRIYNTNDNPVQISNIELEGGTSSQYRINVDGIAADEFTNVEIASGDSLWMFVEVTIDPNALNLPFIVEDRVRFELNGNEQFVELVAWGQNAYYHGSLDQITVLPCNEVWNADLPHIVYGIVAVDEGCSLTINEGTQVHCHAGSGIFVNKGTLDVNGQFGNEVCFQGDRLEQEYQGLPGQWGIELEFEFETDLGIEQATVARGGIWLFETVDCEIDWAIIKNGNIGVQVDTVGSATADALVMRNTKIQNMGVIGILAQGAHISGVNNLVANCGQNCAAFTIGGRYQFAYSTFANYWTDGTRQTPAFVLNNYYVDINQNIQTRTISDTWFHNCIMYGNNAALSDFSEFIVDMQDDEMQDYRFEFCGVDSESSVADSDRYNGMVNGNTPPFTDVLNFDFTLLNQGGSLWTGGLPLGPTLTENFDLGNNFRFLPGTKGCYEQQ